MKQGIFEVLSNETLLPGLHRLRLRGDCSAVQRPGQFVNVQLVRVATHKQEKKSKFQQAKFLHLSQVNL